MENVSNINEILSYLKEKSSYFNKLASDENFLYQEINDLPKEQIEYMISYYNGVKPGPLIILRLVLLKELAKGKAISDNFMQLIKDKFRSKDLEYFEPYLNHEQIAFINQYPENQSPFNIWTTSFGCLYTLIYDGKCKREVKNYLEILAKRLKSELNIEDYKIDITGFDGPRNQGQKNAWVNVFPRSLKNYNNAISYFFEFKDGKFLSGLSKSTKNDLSIKIDIPQDIQSKEYGDIAEAIDALKNYKEFESESNKKIYGEFGIMNPKNLTSREEITTNTLSKELAKLLKNAKNIILHGAPGTGKTYLAHQIADEMGAQQTFVQFHPSYDYTDFVEGLRPSDENTENGQIGFKRIDGAFKKFCAQALDNLEESAKNKKTLQKEKEIKDAVESFVEQAIEEKKEFNTLSNKFYIVGLTDIHIIVSTPDNDKITEYRLPINNLCKMFLWKDKNNLKRSDLKTIFNHKYSNALDSYLFAIYKQMESMNVVQSKKDQPVLVEKKNYVFIIDEINRGDLSKIFGELFFAIDPGYRGKKEKKVQTQYQNLVDEDNVFTNGFYVPDNVYIIGTMNDIDRSVESMDFAFRRRFTFVEITADKTATEILANLDEEHRDKCKKIMEILNGEISNISSLGSPTDYHIGAAYFLKLKDLDYNYEKFWNYHLEGLLKEYFRGMENSEDLLGALELEYKKLI